MRKRVLRFIGMVAFLGCSTALAGKIKYASHTWLDTSLVLKAMAQELQRSLDSLPKYKGMKPYFLSYTIWEVQSYGADASLGAIERKDKNTEKYLTVNLRLGNYQRDNSNFQGSHSYRYTVTASLPQINNETLIRQALWAATDAKYRYVQEQYSQKEAYLKNISDLELLQDFTAKKPSQKYSEDLYSYPDTTMIESKLKSLSGALVKYSHLQESRVSFQYYHTKFYYVDSEGSRYIQSFAEYTLMAAMLCQAEDGEPLWDYYRNTRRNPGNYKWMNGADKNLTETALRLRGLSKSASEKFYRGPVLFSEKAGGEVINTTLLQVQKYMRQPLRENMQSHFLLGLKGKKYFPGFVSVIDDPSRKKWGDRLLHGYYEFDHQGTEAKTTVLVKKGMLNEFYSGRVPLVAGKGHRSNGHLRYNEGMPGVVEVKIKKPLKEKKLRNKLKRLARNEGNSYGLIVSKFADDEAFALLRHPLVEHIDVNIQAGSSEGRLFLKSPVRMDKLDVKTGKLTPVRGLQFVPFDTKSLRSLTAGGKERFLNEPRAVYSVISPGLLFGLLDLKAREKNFPRLPRLN